MTIDDRVKRIAALRRAFIAFDLGLDPREATDDNIRAKDPAAVIETPADVEARLLSSAAELAEDDLDGVAARRLKVALRRSTPEIRAKVYDLLGLPNLSD